MAKTQKNLQFTEEVLAWFDSTEQQTGASHSRIALAAILYYATSDMFNQKFWMARAVQVDKGEVSFKKMIATKSAYWDVDSLEVYLETLAGPLGDKLAVKAFLERTTTKLEALRRRMKERHGV